MPNLDSEIRDGDFSSLLQWLRTNIHNKGRLYTSEGLCAEVTGRPLDVSDFTDYLTDKFNLIY